jgi:hypothetical protein
MNELSNKVNEINNLHKSAINSANNAVNYAKKIGQLLLEIKAELPHGKFSSWVADNIDVSERQAQRYMQAASGKNLRISDFSLKNDMMSDLKEDDPKYRMLNPVWIPPNGHWFKCIDQDSIYIIAPDRLHPEDFHITKFKLLKGSTIDDPKIDWDKNQEIEWTRQPVMAKKVEGMLQVMGLFYPETKAWKFVVKEGLDFAVGVSKDDYEPIYKRGSNV